MKKYCYILFCNLFVFLKGFTQNVDTLTVLLSKKYTYSRDLKMVAPIRELKQKKVLDSIKGIPLDISNYGIFAFDMQVKQGIYQRFLEGELDSSTYYNYVKIYNIDENKLTKNHINERIIVFSGLKDNKKIIICDANNNYNFSGLCCMDKT